MSASQTNELRLPVRRSGTERCAGQHFGPWSVSLSWFGQAVQGVRSGMLRPRQLDDGDDVELPARPVVDVRGGIAVISIEGMMTKGGSSFGGCSTVAVRQAIRSAAMDDGVDGIMLVISSPGGTCAGTADLADDVARAAALKPTYAYIEDLGCSAAYWVASQATRLYANRTATVGSIGTMVVLTDTTGAQEELGIKYTVVSTGDKKGLGADGAVTDELVAEWQGIVDDLNQHFAAAVTAGRGFTAEQLSAVSDGGVWIAQQSLALGLIDEVASLDAAMTAILQETKVSTIEEFNAFATANPDATKSFREAGHTAGLTAGATAERERFAALNTAFPGRPAFVNEQFAKGSDVARANAEFVAVLSAENQQLQQQLAGRTTTPTPTPTPTPTSTSTAAAAVQQPLGQSFAGVDVTATATTPAAFAQAGQEQGAAWAKEQRRLRGLRD